MLLTLCTNSMEFRTVNSQFENLTVQNATTLIFQYVADIFVANKSNGQDLLEK